MSRHAVLRVQRGNPWARSIWKKTTTTMDEEVESRFVCPICCEVLKVPTVVKTCGHKFCAACLRQMPSSGSEDGCSLCPMCRLPFLLEGGCQRDKNLEEEIASTTTTCVGCRQEFSLMHFNSHSVSCSKRKRTAHKFTPVASTSQLPPSPGQNRSTFACPMCPQQNLDCSGLLEHVNKYHANCKESVVCPVCASMPWGNPNQRSHNFVGHMNLRHKFEYETFVDYEQDDDAALQAAIESSQFEQ